MPARMPVELVLGLVDDAAVFPPGLAPLPRAVSEHLARTAYRRFVGPLLVPAGAAGDVVELSGGAPLRLGLIARPGMPLDPVLAGADALRHTSVQLAGVEVGHGSDWRMLAGPDGPGVGVTVEIPRDGFDDALDEVADAAAAQAEAGRAPLAAKFRTGATDVWAWPDEAELERFLRGCLHRGVRFKLTGGLHHALRADHPGPAGGPQHGILNVLATLAAILDGASVPAARELLAQRAAAPLVAIVASLSPQDAAAVRGRFTAYGCCDVLDPLRELAELGLIEKESP